MCRVIMYWFVKILGLFSLVLCNVTPSRIVNLTQGPVRGYKDKNLDVFIFYGIPYATAPTGQDKFKAPLPPPVWSELFEAVDNNIICPQNDVTQMIRGSKNIKEDCLIANVYMPEKNEELLPVLVRFHSGAYAFGHGDISQSEHLVKSKKIVAVTFNHRLGAHGFLCLGTKDVPGNAGMKDQVALLRWVKNNIEKFGGNPNEVTISGHDTGSSSVDILMISKTAQGLFKRVIAESGANTAAFSVQTDPIKNAKRYSELFQRENLDDLNDLELFYKNLSSTELNSKNTLARPDSTFLMSPCVERDVGQEILLDDNPVNILKSGNFEKRPMLYGFSEIDGQLRLLYLEFWEFWMNIRFLEFLPADLQFEDIKEKRKVAEQIKQFYFGDKTIGKETVAEFVKYFTDVMYAYPVLRSVKFQVEAGNNQVFLCMFSKKNFESPAMIFKNTTLVDQCPKAIGVLNDYWEEIKEDGYGAVDLKPVEEILPQVVLNFIISGEPVIPGSKIRWQPVGANWSPYMHIGRTFKLKKSLLKKRALFWENIYNKYYRFPTPPPAPAPKDND
ncbi:juvenile hormone esterase-like [Melitaea cinxia]|uniref:juvenile hormone esterase-like n=1 Tax=Melitaea cinxia TaxID=113334 RepID=UPI001E270869|nr:juvenile hormone esterase-like [Melitaea cinxia]